MVAEACPFCEEAFAGMDGLVEHVLEKHKWKIPFYVLLHGQAKETLRCWCGSTFVEDDGCHPVLYGFHVTATMRWAKHLEERGGMCRYLLEVKLRGIEHEPEHQRPEQKR